MYAGEVNGVTSPIKLFTPFLFTAVTIENGSSEIVIPAGYNTYLYVLEGTVEIQNKQVNAFDVIHFEIAPQSETISFNASSNAKFVVFSGEPIKAPVVARGPFVMNTQEEIAESICKLPKWYVFRWKTLLKQNKKQSSVSRIAFSM